MAEKRERPAPVTTVADLELDSFWASPSLAFTPSHRSLQERFLATRFGVRPDRDRLIAELAFRSGRAIA